MQNGGLCYGCNDCNYALYGASSSCVCSRTVSGCSTAVCAKQSSVLGCPLNYNIASPLAAATLGTSALGGWYLNQVYRVTCA